MVATGPEGPWITIGWDARSDQTGRGLGEDRGKRLTLPSTEDRTTLETKTAEPKKARKPVPGLCRHGEGFTQEKGATRKKKKGGGLERPARRLLKAGK